MSPRDFDIRDERRRRDKAPAAPRRSLGAAGGTRPRPASQGTGAVPSRGNGDIQATLEQASCRGMVKRLILDKGFGFIIREDSGLEYFFHRSACLMEGGLEGLQEGQLVIFDAMKSIKGLRAQQVRNWENTPE